MNKIFTLILIVVSGTVIAQRPGFDFDLMPNGGKINITNNEIKNDNDLFLLYPGNWEDAEEAATYYWYDGEVNMGFIFGTNYYGDEAYGQIFQIDNSYIIHGAYYWIGERSGEEGEVEFAVWNYTNGAAGNVMGSKTIPMAEIEKSEYSDEAFWVEFDSPVFVTSDFLIGADISGLDEFEEGIYGMGNVSSLNGDGGGEALALILEEGNWRPVLDYDMDVDIAIFPLVETAASRSVTFNVNMKDATAEGDVEFDPEIHNVYLSGSFNNWKIPGEDQSYKLEVVNGKNNSDKGESLYTVTIQNIPTGKHFYKYYITEDVPTWDMAEYPEDATDRVLMVEEDMEVNDVFGSVLQANIVDFWFLKQDDNNQWVDAEVVDKVNVEYIDENFGEVDVYVKFGTNINELMPSMTITYQADIEPNPGAGDFDSFGEQGAKVYTVTSVDPDITKDWKITIHESDGVSVPETEYTESKLTLYPNPVRDVLTVESSDVISTVRIFDITGRMVYAGDVNDNRARINVSDFYYGVHVIQVITGKGVQSRKFQISK